MNRITHNLIQGSPEWHAYRADPNRYNASEAAAMLGLDKNVKRNDLLRAKATGVPLPVSDYVDQIIFANGHRVEPLVRVLIEEIIGEELYPTVMSYGKMSASSDGVTASGEISFECKQWNEELAASLRAGVLPDEHWPQVQQNLGVTGADVLYFACGDGTRERLEYLIVKLDADKWEVLTFGWEQFEKDLANYKPQEVIPAAVAAPVMALPTVSIQVTGAVALASNLDLFHGALKAYIAKIPAKPSTDQEFADCKAAVKALKDAEEALDAAEKQALGQVASFDDMRRAKQLCFDLSRQTRLALDKLVTRRESEIKAEIIAGGRLALAAHIEEIDKDIGHRYMPLLIPDRFAEVIKRKSTVAALQNAVDTELARLKIEADAIGRTIRANLKTLAADAKDHEFLFIDIAAVIYKAPDDFRALVALRISEHEAKQEAKRKADEEAARAKPAAPPIIETTAHHGPTACPQGIATAPSQEGVGRGVSAGAVARPSREFIVGALARHFYVSPLVAEQWLREEFGGGSHE